jgi:cytochrome c
MPNRLVLSVTAALAAAAAGCRSDAAARSPSAPPATFPEQVALGQSLYARHCAECHGDAGEGDEAPRVVGLAQGALPLDPPPGRKVRTTRFVTVADVAEFVVANMPPKRAGSLSTDEYLAVLAFDLKANGIDLGREPLTLDQARGLVIPR